MAVDSLYTQHSSSNHGNGSWNPEVVLKIRNYEHSGGWTCVGFAPTKGRRCQNPINHMNRATAGSIIKKLSLVDPGKTNIAPLLQDLAGHLLCLRYHQSQVGEVTQRWTTSIASMPPEMRLAAVAVQCATSVVSITAEERRIKEERDNLNKEKARLDERRRQLDADEEVAKSSTRLLDDLTANAQRENDRLAQAWADLRAESQRITASGTKLAAATSELQWQKSSHIESMAALKREELAQGVERKSLKQLESRLKEEEVRQQRLEAERGQEELARQQRLTALEARVKDEGQRLQNILSAKLKTENESKSILSILQARIVEEERTLENVRAAKHNEENERLTRLDALDSTIINEELKLDKLIADRLNEERLYKEREARKRQEEELAQELKQANKSFVNAFKSVIPVSLLSKLSISRRQIEPEEKDEEEEDTRVFCCFC